MCYVKCHFSMHVMPSVNLWLFFNHIGKHNKHVRFARGSLERQHVGASALKGKQHCICSVKNMSEDESQ